MKGVYLGALILILWILIKLTNLYQWNKKINRITNISLFIFLFILPDSIACIVFLILVLRLITWLFGSGQDMMDNYYYSRYERAKRNYNRRER